MSAEAALLRELLARGLAEIREAGGPGAGLPELPAASQEALVGLAQAVARWTARVDLTGHRGAEAVLRGLVLDALALAAAAPPFQSLVDLGSGAGFPGLPVAIAWPERRVTLVEARSRRHHFQRAVVRELALANAEPRLGRAEELDPRPHDAAVAQAMAPSDPLLAWMLRWSRPGGLLLLPGGPRPPSPAPHPGVRPEETRSYRVPLSGAPRTLWIGRRLAAAPDAGAGPGESGT